jgi:hypothetical protein
MNKRNSRSGQVVLRFYEKKALPSKRKGLFSLLNRKPKDSDKFHVEFD